MGRFDDAVEKLYDLWRRGWITSDDFEVERLPTGQVRVHDRRVRTRPLGPAVVAPPTYCNTEQSYTASCPTGYIGDSVTVTKAADTYCGYATQAAANAAALAAAQSEAEAALVCESDGTYCNTEQSYTASCPSGYTGDSVTVTKAAGTYCGYATQEEADAAALAAAQSEAEASLACTPITYCNTEQSYTATCPSGTFGDSVTVTKDAGTYCGYASQAEADAAALAAAQSEAEAALVCVYCNTEQSYTASCSSGFAGSSVTVTKAAGTYCGYASQAEADAAALAAAQAEAEAALVCESYAAHDFESLTAGNISSIVGPSVAVGDCDLGTASFVIGGNAYGAEDFEGLSAGTISSFGAGSQNVGDTSLDATGNILDSNAYGAETFETLSDGTISSFGGGSQNQGGTSLDATGSIIDSNAYGADTFESYTAGTISSFGAGNDNQGSTTLDATASFIT